jgi:hypothetical protein
MPVLKQAAKSTSTRKAAGESLLGDFMITSLFCWQEPTVDAVSIQESGAFYIAAGDGDRRHRQFERVKYDTDVNVTSSPTQ